MPSGTWYIISREIQNSYPQMMPKIPPKTSYLGPPERIFKVWELCSALKARREGVKPFSQFSQLEKKTDQNPTFCS